MNFASVLEKLGYTTTTLPLSFDFRVYKNSKCYSTTIKYKKFYKYIGKEIYTWLNHVDIYTLIKYGSEPRALPIDIWKVFLGVQHGLECGYDVLEGASAFKLHKQLYHGKELEERVALLNRIIREGGFIKYITTLESREKA